MSQRDLCNMYTANRGGGLISTPPPLGEKWVVHFTPLPGREMEQSYLSPRRYNYFNLHTHKQLISVYYQAYAYNIFKLQNSTTFTLACSSVCLQLRKCRKNCIYLPWFYSKIKVWYNGFPNQYSCNKCIG